MLPGILHLQSSVQSRSHPIASHLPATQPRVAKNTTVYMLHSCVAAVCGQPSHYVLACKTHGRLTAACRPHCVACRTHSRMQATKGCLQKEGGRFMLV